MPIKYLARAPEVHAVQFTGTDTEPLPFNGEAGVCCFDGDYWFVPAALSWPIREDQNLEEGMWVVRHGPGKYQVLEDEAFHALYED